MKQNNKKSLKKVCNPEITYMEVFIIGHRLFFARSWNNIFLYEVHSKQKQWVYSTNY
jgi:hypothetical protein